MWDSSWKGSQENERVVESKPPPGLLEVSEMQSFLSMGHSTSLIVKPPLVVNYVISDARCISPYVR